MKEHFMDEYKVKGSEGVQTYLSILGEEGDGYNVKIKTVTEYNTKEVYQHLSRHLFEACLRTGYLTKLETETSVAQA
jgi:hypothetical protein